MISRYKPFFRLGESVSSQDIILMFKDQIDMHFINGNMEKVKSLSDRLHQKYGVKYDPSKGKVDFKTFPINTDSPLDKSYFHFFEDYKKYCLLLNKKRWEKYRSLYNKKVASTTLSRTDIITLFDNIKYADVKFVDRMPSSNAAAQVVGNTILLYDDGTVMLDVFVHEFGHVFDHHKGDISMKPTTDSSKLHNASTSYQNNPMEVFADNFNFYILQPRFQKVASPLAYNELDRLIPKNLVRLLRGFFN